MSSNSNDINFFYYDKLENIARKLDKIGDKFISLLYIDENMDKDMVFIQIGYDLKSVSSDINFIKNKFKD